MAKINCDPNKMPRNCGYCGETKNQILSEFMRHVHCCELDNLERNDELVPRGGLC